MAYGSSSDVGFLTPNLLGGGSDFSTSTSPTQTAVNRWLSSGSSWIDTLLNAAGYAASAPSTAAVFDELRQINTLYAAGFAEASRANVRLGPGERTRGQLFLELAEKRMEALVRRDLAAAGLALLSSVGPEAGGIEESRKLTVQDDSDLVKPRFARGQFRYAGAMKPRYSGS